MDEFPGNAKHVARPTAPGAPAPDERPKIEKIVTGPVVKRKTPVGIRIKNYFIGGDARGAGQHVVNEVLGPALRDMLFDAVTTGAEAIIFKATGGRVNTNSTRRLMNQAQNSVVQYNRFGGNANAITGSTTIRNDPRNDPRPQLSREARATHNFGEIILATRPEALEVLGRMQGLVAKYDTCSVAELYSMLGISSEFTDEAYGWYDLTNVGVHRARGGGYQLDLPKPEPLS